MLTSNDTILLTESLDFYKQLSSKEQALFLEHISTATFKKGQTIHFADRDCIGLLFIKSGALRTYLLSEDGREITLYRLGERDFCILSAACVLKTITFDVYIEATEDLTILTVPSNILEKLTDSNIYVKASLYELATERFSDVMWAMQQLLFMSFDKRLASFLLDEAAATGLDVIHMTHEQIAKYIGSAREVVSRMLKYFELEQMIALSRGTITIVDKKALRSLL